MNARYHLALVSFCTDLVRPDSSSIPVGVFVVGEAGGHATAVLGVREALPVSRDLPPVVRRLVCQFPALLSAQIDELLRTTGPMSIDDVMEAFEDSLRNSFHVSAIDTKEHVELSIAEGVRPETEDDVRDALSAMLMGRMSTAVAAVERSIRADEARREAAVPEPLSVHRIRPWSSPPEQVDTRVAALA